MNIPQLKSAWSIIFAIFVVSLSAGVASASLHGEIHSWANLGEALKDGSLFAVVAIFGWVGLKSPWAKQVRELLRDESATVSTTTLPSGATITEQTKIVATRETTEPQDSGAPTL